MGYRTTKSKIKERNCKTDLPSKLSSNKSSSYADFFYHTFRNILIVSLPLLVISALILGFNVSYSSATVSNSGTDQIQFSLSTSCTMSSVVNTAHIKEISNGTYHSNVGKTTITTLCNDGNGYNIYANGFSNNEEGNNKLINSEHSEFSIDTGLNTSGSTSAWAMKLNNIPDDPSPTPPVIDPSYNNTYGLVPTYWTKVASRASGTTDMDEGSSFTTTYAIYTTSNQHAGTYNGQVKYVLTHPSTQMVAYYMQDVANWQNKIPNSGDTLLATDARDNKEYWVARLADGHIWMTQNLNFDINANTVLSSQTTDLNVIYNSSTGQYTEYNDGYTENGGIIYWRPTSSATTINFEGTTITGWTNNNTEPYSASKIDDKGVGHASLGNYYNWTAAIASNDSSSLTTGTYNDVSGNPQNSICPKGWRLPTISSQSETLPGSTNEFARLNYLYNNGLTNSGLALKSSPLWFIFGANTASPTNGYYTSSTNGNASNMYNFQFSNNSVSTASLWSGGSKSYTFNARCIAH